MIFPKRLVAAWEAGITIDLKDLLVKTTAKVLKMIFTLTLLSGLYSCAEVGSEKWCKKMEEKPTDKWTIAETKDYTRHCVFK